MFSTGASGLVNEYVLATITTYILGNSIEQFSIVIALMMLMMGISGIVQQKLDDTNLVRKFILVEAAMAVLGGYAPVAIYGAYAGLESHFLLVHYFFILAIGFLIGFEIPIVMRIIEQQKVNLKTNLAIVYAMDYVGAFIGAVIWVKFLLRTFPLTEISFIVAGFNFLVAAVTVFYFVFKKVPGLGKMAPLTIMLVTASLAWGYANNREMSDYLEQHFYDDRIIYKKTTRYQHIVITRNENLDETRLYLNGHTQFSSVDEKRYHEMLVHPAMKLSANAENVLILGGGDGLALREVLKYRNTKTISVVDLDPEMIRLASSHEKLTELNRHAFRDARVKALSPGGITDTGVVSMMMEGENEAQQTRVASVTVFNLDADRFLEIDTDISRWEVVIIDLPDPASVELAKLYSKQFYTKLKRKLAPGAIVALQATSPYHAKESYLTVGRTLNAAGLKTVPYHVNVPSFGDWGFYLAWAGDPDIPEVRKRLSAIGKIDVATDYISPEIIAASLVFGNDELRTESDCVNTLMFPCLLSQYIDQGWKIY